MSTNGESHALSGPLEAPALLGYLMSALGEKDQFVWWPMPLLWVSGQHFL